MSPNCEKGYYRFKESKDYKQSPHYKFIKVRNLSFFTCFKYGVGTAEGFIAKDKMYFDRDGKIGLDSAEFIAVPPI